MGLSGMTYDDDVEVAYQASQLDRVVTTAPTITMPTPTESKKSENYKGLIPSLWAVATAMLSLLIFN
jgi:hypothetical protein